MKEKHDNHTVTKFTKPTETTIVLSSLGLNKIILNHAEARKINATEAIYLFFISKYTLMRKTVNTVTKLTTHLITVCLCFDTNNNIFKPKV